MAETPTGATKTAAPRRGTTRANKPAAAKPAASKSAATAAATGGDEVTTTIGPISLVADGETKKYSRWDWPDGIPCVGKVYAPLGATEVKVVIVGPASDS